MDILFCHYNNICEKGIIRGFEQLGHNLYYLNEPLSNSDTNTSYIKLVSDFLLTKKIDFVFSINFAPIISKVCGIHKIPYVCWVVTSPLIQLYSDALTSIYNYIFLFDYMQYEEFHQKNPGHVFYLPLGCDLELWDQIKIKPQDQQRFSCDVSFVGSLYNEKCDYNKLEQEFPEHLRGYFEGLLAAQKNIYGYNILRDTLSDKILEEYKEATDIKYLSNYNIDDRIILSDMILADKCTELERIHLLNSLAKHFTVDLYTQSDTSQLVGVKCHSGVSSDYEMPKVFKCSKINLNITARGIQTGAALRIFDILGCKGFLLCNYQMELLELFEPGKDLILFESELDLIEKIKYYLAHDDERQEIADHGYQTVSEYYSYTKRLDCMLKTLPF